MSNSSLVSYTRTSPNSSARTQPISKITVHHMAGCLSVEQCGAVFASSARQASSNYGVGSDGRVALYVPESRRAWTSSSAWNDQRAVTIEVANSATGGEWPVSDKAWAALVELCVDICQRNGISALTWTGDKSGSLTCHYFYAATNCPGPYLKARMAELAQAVTARLAGKGEAKPVAPATETTGALEADGWWGSATTLRAQQLLGLVADGEVWGQNAAHRSRVPGCTSGWKWRSGSGIIGSPLIRALQAKWGATADGVMGPDTINAMIRYYQRHGSGATVCDGRLDSPSLTIKAFQRRLSQGLV